MLENLRDHDRIFNAGDDLYCTVRIKELKPNRRILFEWHYPAHLVDFNLEDRDDGTTLVRVTVKGFHGDDDECVAAALDSMGGFSFLLSSMKTWLEHRIELNVVADHHPDHHVDK